MLPGPVFTVELLTSARRRRYYAIRTLYGLALLALLASNYGSSLLMMQSTETPLTANMLSGFARQMFRSFAWVQAAAILGLTPALVAGTVADEARRKTLHYLLASRLSGAEIVLGKLMARLLHVGVLMAIGLPVMSLLTLFGGVDPNEVLAAYAATATTAYLLAAMSILVSTLANRPRDAILRAYGLEFLWLTLPPVVAYLVPRVWPVVDRFTQPINAWIYPTNPFWLLEATNQASGQGSIAGALAWTCSLQVAYGTLAVALATWRLRPSFRARGSGRLSRLWPTRTRPSWRLFPRPACGDAPILWKELHVRRSVGLARFAEILIGLAIFAGIGDGVYVYAPDAFGEVRAYGYDSGVNYRHREDFSIFLRMVTTSLYIVAALGVAALAAGSLTGEREGDTWISLVTTDLTGREILLGKLIGAVWAVRWLLVTNLALAVLGMAAGAVHPLGLLAIAIETAAFIGFAAALGISFSLRSRTTIGAMGSTVALLIFLNGGYLICGSPLAFIRLRSSLSWLILMGVSPMVYACSLLNSRELATLLSPDRHWPGDMREVVALSFSCTIAYALAALYLTEQSIRRFDRAVGRPERSGQSAPPVKRPAAPPPPAGPPVPS